MFRNARPMNQRTKADQQVPAKAATHTSSDETSGASPASACACAAEIVPDAVRLRMVAVSCSWKFAVWSEMIPAKETSNVGTRQLARFRGEAMTSSKTSVGETKMLKSFWRTVVCDATEAGREVVIAGMLRLRS